MRVERADAEEVCNHWVGVQCPRVLQEMLGVLSDPDWGAAIVASGHVSRRLASWRTRAASSRLEFVRVPSEFLSEISELMMLGSQGCRHMILVPDLGRFSHTSPALMPEAFQNPRCVVS